MVRTRARRATYVVGCCSVRGQKSAAFTYKDGLTLRDALEEMFESLNTPNGLSGEI